MYLFCIPAGGTNPFPAWKKKIGSSVKLHVLDLPGRGSRRREAVEEKFELLVDNMIAEMEKVNVDNEPFILFGYCFGAIIGYEMCKQLQRNGKKLPTYLITFGSAAPGSELSANETNRVDTDEFRKMVAQFLSPIAVGSNESATAAQNAYIAAYKQKKSSDIVLSDVFQDVDEEDEFEYQMLIDLLNDSMRQIEMDDRMLREYGISFKGPEEVNVSAKILYGDADSFVPGSMVIGWQKCFAESEVICISGDHYSIATEPQPFVDVINKL